MFLPQIKLNQLPDFCSGHLLILRLNNFSNRNIFNILTRRTMRMIFAGLIYVPLAVECVHFIKYSFP